MSSKMLSLYDYLGRPAGKALGYAIAHQAHSLGAHVEHRYVENPVYKGNVNLYCEDLLKSFFKNPAYKNVIENDVKEYTLKQLRRVKWGK